MQRQLGPATADADAADAADASDGSKKRDKNCSHGSKQRQNKNKNHRFFSFLVNSEKTKQQKQRHN